MVIFDETIHALTLLVSFYLYVGVGVPYTMYNPTLREDGLSGCTTPVDETGSCV